MSLYGALFSGVSGLVAQSSAMGAISDNITNVSTVGYKETTTNFQTLVTKQASATFYSAGGVQSKPRHMNDVQGLLQASTSQTDISVSGSGFFVVNEVARPGIQNQYLYTRAGSFTMDDQGYLRNAAGFYLQAWPTDARGTVTPANPNLTVTNQNIISSDYLETVNLNRVGGTAAATTSIQIGANLPSNATAGATHKTDVQFFDSLGNSNNISLVYTRSPRGNQWDVSVNPAQQTAVATMEDASGRVYSSVGQLEFTSRPADGARVVIDGVTYEFNSAGGVTAGNIAVNIATNTTVSQDVAALVAAVKANDTEYGDYGGYTNTRISISPASSNTVLFTEDGTAAITVNPIGLLDAAGDPVTQQTDAFTVAQQNELYTDFTQFTFGGIPAAGTSITINGTVYSFVNGAPGSTTQIQVDGAATLPTVLAALETAIETNDPAFSGTRVRVRDSGGGGVDTLVLESLPSGSYNVVNDTGAALTVAGGALANGATQAVNTGYAITFDVDGLPAAFNIAELEILGFTNGAADMDDAVNHSPQITLDFGSIGEADGMTQFGEEFTPIFINQNGSKFGTFAGLTIGTDGLVTALFDNGETRIIYKIPLATFINANGLESKTGNVWTATDASGNYTLREPDNGPAGQVIQAALESSTVDIGTEFTQMIVVQRAYSASTKIISTADEMLEELMAVKR